MERISYLLGSVQRSLFPYLQEEVGDLTEKERRFVLVLEVVEIEKHVRKVHWHGRNPKDRKPLAQSYVAKAFYNIPTTGALLERLKRDRTFRRLCEWEFWYQVPSESTFSRAFDAFAVSGLTDKVHEALVKGLACITGFDGDRGQREASKESESCRAQGEAQAGSSEER